VSEIKAPDTSIDLACRLDSPLERPNGEEDDNTSPEVHAQEFEGDTIVHDSQDKTDQARFCSDDEANRNHPDPDQPTYDDEAYEHDGPSSLRHHTDNADSQVVEETYVNHVEPVNKSFKTSRPASYYGDGWGERSPPPLAIQLQAHQQVTLPIPSIPKYPHVSEIIPHWTHFADPHANKDVPFCKQLAQGKCSQGDRCRFRHSLTIEEYILLFNDQQPSLWTLQRNDNNHETAVSSPASAQPQVDSSQSSSAVTVKSSTFGQECSFYPIGKCRNGDLCPYQHTQHPIAPAATVSIAHQNWQTSERPAFATQNSRRPCKFYLDRGYCRRGLSCIYGHGDHPDGDHPSSGPSGPESTPSLVDDDKGWSTGREERNKAKNNNSEGDTPVENNGWGVNWDAPSNLEDHSAWDSPAENTHSHQPRQRKSNVCFQNIEGRCHRGEACKFSHDQELSKTPLSSEASKTWSESQPKAQVEDSHIPENEASWSEPWSTETVQPPSLPIKFDAPCKRFGQGYCPFGDDCTYLHIEVTDIVEHASSSEEDVAVSISQSSCALAI
jgi:hypothetical protein